MQLAQQASAAGVPAASASELIDTTRIKVNSVAAQYLLARQQIIDGTDPIPYCKFQWGDSLILDGFQVDMLRSIFNPQIREVWAKGNTGCGKTGVGGMICSLFFDLWPDARVVITRDSYERAVSLAYGEVRKWFLKMRIPPVASVQAERIIDPMNRQRVIECANPFKEEGFSGAHSEHVLFWFEEATAIPDSRFDLANTQATKFVALANPRTTGGAFRAAFGNDDPDRTQTIVGPYGLRRLITIGGMDCLNVRAKCLRRPISPPGGITIGDNRYLAGSPISRDDFDCCKPIIPGQTCYDEYQGHLQNPDSDWVDIFAHGRFPKEDPERQVIRGKWLVAPGRLWARFNRAWDRTRGRHSEKALRKLLNRWHPVEAFGLDVALSAAGDESVLTAGGSRGVRQQHSYRFKNAHDLVNWVIETARECYGIDLCRGGVPVGVDCDGMGLPIAQMFQKRGVRVIEIRGNATPEVDPKAYVNFRAEGYGELGKRLDPESAWSYQLQADNSTREGASDLVSRTDRPMVFLIPPDSELHRQIRAHEKIFPQTDSMRFKVTPKDKSPGNEDDAKIRTVKEKIGRSPDHSDSLVYFYRALQHKGFDLDQWLKAGAL